MYYDSAALSGGMTMAEAADALRGGWEVPQRLTAQQQPDFNQWGQHVLSIPGVQGVLADIQGKYDIPPDTLALAATIAYMKDSAMMSGAQRFAEIADAQVRGSRNPPAMRKLVSLIRRKIHVGNTKRYKLPPAERARRRAEVARLRQANRATLARLPWFGSDPYNAFSTGTAKNYLYTYPGLGKTYRTGIPRLLPRLQPPPELPVGDVGELPQA